MESEDGYERSAPLLRVLGGQAVAPPPIWLMRQAGRYLPEYGVTRSRAASFLELCYTPELAVQATLQPIRRFDFDAAILFSDILVVPDALGQQVRFVEGEGPRLEPLRGGVASLRPQGFLEHLAPVMEAVRQARRQLDPGKALIGFCGAPWTVATYMIAGRGTPDQQPARRFALERPDDFRALIDLLTQTSADYLVAQLQAGANCVQIFDSWAGVLDDSEFERWSVRPAREIVERVRTAMPGARVIGFPRGAAVRFGAYATMTGVDAVSVDWTMSLRHARTMVPQPIALQGNLDPLRLVVGGSALDEGIDEILAAMRGRAHIFNLGHGILPQTPIANVERMIERVRSAA